MQRVGIKALKNNLSQYVRAAAAGERVLVTDRDKVVAELVPPRPVATTSEEFVLRGVREGWLSPATRKGPLPDRGPPPPDEPPVSFERLMEDLARDREDRWPLSDGQ